MGRARPSWGARTAPPDATKSAFGETTTRQEKVRAFRHWVATVTQQLRQPTVLIARLDGQDAPPPAVFVVGSPAVCQLLEDQEPERQLPSAHTVLRCVFDQWRRLQVWQLPSGVITRIIGKQTMELDERAPGVEVGGASV